MARVSSFVTYVTHVTHVTYLTNPRCFNIFAPHNAEEADALAKGAEVERLNEIGVGAQFIGPFDILLKIGTGHHNDRDKFEVLRRMRMQPFEKIKPAHSRHP